MSIKAIAKSIIREIRYKKGPHINGEPIRT